MNAKLITYFDKKSKTFESGKILAEDGLFLTIENNEQVAKIERDNLIENLKPPSTEYNPYDHVKIVGNKLIVDDDKLDINYKYKRKNNSDKIKHFKQIKSYEKLRKVYFDIETSGLDWKTNRIYMIGLQLNEEDPIIITNNCERKLLLEFIKVLRQLQPEIIVGHNVFNFDFPFVAHRCKLHKIRSPWLIAEYEQEFTAASINGSAPKFTPAYMKNVSLIDTWLLTGAHDKIFACFTHYSLKRVAIDLGFRESQRLELSAEEIKECWNNNHERLAEYLKYDLQDTEYLANFFIPQNYYQLELIPLKLQKLCYSSPAKKWNEVLEEYYNLKPKNNIQVFADPKLKYKGGYTSVNKGLYKGIGKIDVGSMYPSIQLLYGLFGQKDKDEYYLNVLSYLIGEKKRYKNLYKASKDFNDYAKSWAYKILINGGYGFSGTGGYKYNCMKTASLITGYGRILVKIMEQSLLEFGAKIIEIDTDGIYYQCDDINGAFEYTQDKLPRGIDIELEYGGEGETNLFVPLAKNYILFKPNGKIDIKGKYRKRNRCKVIKDFSLEYVKKYFESPENATKYYEEIIYSILDRTINPEKLKIREKVSKSSKAMVSYGMGNPGDIIEYWCNWNYARKEKLPVKSHTDYHPKYYVDEINDALTEILECAGENNIKSKLIDNGGARQLSLFG